MPRAISGSEPIATMSTLAQAERTPISSRSDFAYQDDQDERDADRHDAVGNEDADQRSDADAQQVRDHADGGRGQRPAESRLQNEHGRDRGPHAARLAGPSVRGEHDRVATTACPAYTQASANVSRLLSRCAWIESKMPTVHLS